MEGKGGPLRDFQKKNANKTKSETPTMRSSYLIRQFLIWQSEQRFITKNVPLLEYSIIVETDEENG